MGKNRNRPEPPRPNATLDEVATDEPVVAGDEVGLTIEHLATFGVERKEAEPATSNVVPLHPVADEAPPVSVKRSILWIVPRSMGTPMAHAYREGEDYTLCGIYRTRLAVYPPAPALRRCEVCEGKVTP